jgi:hypothetical protein
MTRRRSSRSSREEKRRNRDEKEEERKNTYFSFEGGREGRTESVCVVPMPLVRDRRAKGKKCHNKRRARKRGKTMNEWR